MATEWIMVRMPRTLHDRIELIRAERARAVDDGRLKGLESEDGPEAHWRIIELLVRRHEQHLRRQRRYLASEKGKTQTQAYRARKRSRMQQGKAGSDGP